MEGAIRVAAPEPSSSSAPDRITDVVLGNLLPVESYPGTVWSAPTQARQGKDVSELIERPMPYILREKRLYTFADLTRDSEPLRAVLSTSDLQSHAVAAWIDDPDHWRWFIDLMHKSLRAHIGGLPIRRDDHGRYFFRPNKDGTTRKWQNGSDPEREVAAFKRGQDDASGFWVHQAADLRFQTLGDQIYLLIDPSYVFTVDGNESLPGMKVGPLSIKWGGKKRNAAILRHVMFWTRTLSRGRAKIVLSTGANPIVLSGIPAFARAAFGIEFDHIDIGTLLAQVEDELSLAATIASTQVGITISDDTDQDTYES